MNCIDARPLLFAFADHELEVGQYFDVLDHLRVCPQCVETVADHQLQDSGVSRIMEDEQMPVDLFAHVMIRISGEQAVQHYSSTW